VEALQDHKTVINIIDAVVAETEIFLEKCRNDDRLCGGDTAR